MDIKSVKKLFYGLFVLDIAAGFVVGAKFNFVFGIITSAVLLIINVIGYAVILKMEKKANEKRQKDGAL
ncbi:MAG: hypothetical protein LBB93_00625 [Elusimicrobiota bacterium]|jgi:hypothetical protein|nr:hypothetical protein [Elusimicrobiota bacterium]